VLFEGAHGPENGASLFLGCRFNGWPGQVFQAFFHD